MVNGSRYYRALESVSIASALSTALIIYPDPRRPRTLNADSLKLQLLTARIGLTGLSSVLRPRQHSIGYMGLGDGFYRSKDQTNSIKVLKEQILKISRI